MIIVKDHEKEMKEALTKLKNNLENVGRETLVTRYKTAYTKLIKEIGRLNQIIIREKIMFLDLNLIPEEKRSDFKEIIEAHAPEIKKHLLAGNYDDYMKTIDEVSILYASHWCDHVIRSHQEGTGCIFNAYNLEEEKFA